MTFSASDAAFEGFRIVRRRPLAVLAWALAYIVAFALGFALVGKTALMLVQQVEALQGVTQPTMAELAPLFRGYGVVLGVAGPLSILIGTMLSTAVARSVVEPKASAFGYLRLGKDELRVFGAMVVLYVLAMAYYMVAVAVCVAIGVFAHLSGQWWLWLFCVAAAIAAILTLIWLAVRLSLMVPIIVAEKRFALFDSFKLTKGQFWPLLGMALLALVMAIVVSFLGTIVSLPLRLPLTAPFSQIQDPSEVMPLILQHIGLIIPFIVINTVLAVLQMAVMYAPFAAAYRAIKGEPVAPVAAG